MTTYETRQVVVAGVRSPVLLGGPASLADSDEAVVFVHGNPDSGANWMPLMREVAPFARVIAPDMPGFGEAEGRADQEYTNTGHAEHLDGILEQLGVRRVHLVGHDFGGPWGLHWAAQHPEKVASVVMINSGVLVDYRWHRMARIWRVPGLGELFMRTATPRILRALLRHDNPGLSQEWVRTIASDFHKPATKRAVLRLARATEPDSMEPLVKPLRECNLPALVVWGAADVYIPVEQAEKQRLTFPDARITLLPGVGHWAWLEAPDQVAAEVVPFLQDQLALVDR